MNLRGSLLGIHMLLALLNSRSGGVFVHGSALLGNIRINWDVLPASACIALPSCGVRLQAERRCEINLRLHTCTFSNYCKFFRSVPPMRLCR